MGGFTTSSDARRRVRLHAAGLVALTALCGARAAYALDPGRALSQYVRDHWRSLQGPIGDAGVQVYDALDGQLDGEGVRRHRSVVSDGLGRGWISTARGLSVVDPARADTLAMPPPARVEQILADGSAISLGGRVTVPAGSRRVAIVYAGLNLSIPERIRFRYRLDGFDNEWSAPSAERQAVYTNLGPGPYRFRVMASNSDGVWSTREATIGFRVQPTFWQTWWFQLAAVLVGTAAVWGVHRLRVLQVARQLDIRFEERLAERTRIAQELHDTLLQGFLSASMQLHVVAARVPDESPMKPMLDAVLKLVSRVIEEGRNAVRGLRSAGVDPHDLEQAFAGIQRELETATTTSYQVVVKGRPRLLNPMVRDEVYRIGRESVVNAFRHARATSLEVELEYGLGELRLTVRDDGHGIELGVLHSRSERPSGLVGMRERAEQLGARLTVRSRIGSGTEVTLVVPGHIAFLKKAARFRERSDVLSRRLSRARDDGEMEKVS